MPNQVKQSFVISDTRATLKLTERQSIPGIWHRMLYGCTHMATVCIKGLNCIMSVFIIKLLLYCIVSNLERPGRGECSRACHAAPGSEPETHAAETALHCVPSRPDAQLTTETPPVNIDHHAQLHINVINGVVNVPPDTA